MFNHVQLETRPAQRWPFPPVPEPAMARLSLSCQHQRTTHSHQFILLPYRDRCRVVSLPTAQADGEMHSGGTPNMSISDPALTRNAITSPPSRRYRYVPWPRFPIPYPNHQGLYQTVQELYIDCSICGPSTSAIHKVEFRISALQTATVQPKLPRFRTRPRSCLAFVPWYLCLSGLSTVYVETVELLVIPGFD